MDFKKSGTSVLQKSLLREGGDKPQILKKYLQKKHMTKDCYPKYTKNSQNLTIKKKQATRLKNRPKIWIASLPRKIWVCVFSLSVMSDSFWPHVTHHAPLSMQVFRQEYWSGLPFPTPGDLSNPGIEPTSSALAGGFSTTSTTWEAKDRQMTNKHMKRYSTP